MKLEYEFMLAFVLILAIVIIVLGVYIIALNRKVLMIKMRAKNNLLYFSSHSKPCVSEKYSDSGYNNSVVVVATELPDYRNHYLLVYSYQNKKWIDVNTGKEFQKPFIWTYIPKDINQFQKL